jgi:hypothetical protein
LAISGTSDGERAVHLDLDEAEIGVGLDRGERLVGRVDEHAGRSGELAGAVDKPGAQHARPELVAARDPRHPRAQRLGVVGEVAHGGDAVGERQRAVVVLHVDVHVPEPGEHDAAVRVDHVGAAAAGPARAPAVVLTG